MQTAINKNLALKEKLSPVINSIDGTIGIYAAHVANGEIFSHNSNETFYLASTYKIPIVVQFLRLLDAGLVDLNQRVEIKPEDIPPFSPILDHRHFSYPGVALSIHNLLRLMLEYSDNTASDLILKLAGGVPEVRKSLNEFGFSKDISVDCSTAEALSEDFTEVSPYSINSGKPQAMANFLKQILERKFLSESSTQFLLECMQKCKTGTNRIRALLPEGTPVADKTGTLTGFVNDIAIIDLPRDSGKIILAVYIKETTVPMKQSETVIANIAKIIFDHTH